MKGVGLQPQSSPRSAPDYDDIQYCNLETFLYKMLSYISPADILYTALKIMYSSVNRKVPAGPDNQAHDASCTNVL